MPTIYEAARRHAARRVPRLRADAGDRHVDACRASPPRPTRRARRTVQYFEMMGHRGIYADGWKAVTRHLAGVPFDDDQWELYHVEVDRSECHDLAADEPERLAALVELWWQRGRGARRAARSTTAPSSCSARASATARRTAPTATTPTARRCRRCPRRWARRSAAAAGTSTPRSTAPRATNGVLYATGTENSGVSVFVQGERLVLDYNDFGDHHVVESDREVPVGASIVGVRFRRTGGPGDKTGHATLVDRRRGERRARRPVRDAHHLEHRPERRPRPRLAGERPLPRRVPVRGHARAGRHPARRPSGAPRPPPRRRRRARRRWAGSRWERCAGRSSSTGRPTTSGRSSATRPRSRSWFPGIVDAQVDGTTRVITTASGIPMPEEIVTNDAIQRRFQYRLTGGLVRSHLGTIDVFDLGRRPQPRDLRHRRASPTRWRSSSAAPPATRSDELKRPVRRAES